jgi:hypothetical protein
LILKSVNLRRRVTSFRTDQGYVAGSGRPLRFRALYLLSARGERC